MDFINLIRTSDSISLSQRNLRIYSSNSGGRQKMYGGCWFLKQWWTNAVTRCPIRHRRVTGPGEPIKEITPMLFVTSVKVGGKEDEMTSGPLAEYEQQQL